MMIFYQDEKNKVIWNSNAVCRFDLFLSYLFPALEILVCNLSLKKCEIFLFELPRDNRYFATVLEVCFNRSRACSTYLSTVLDVCFERARSKSLSRLFFIGQTLTCARL